LDLREDFNVFHRLVVERRRRSRIHSKFGEESEVSDERGKLKHPNSDPSERGKLKHPNSEPDFEAHVLRKD